MFIDIAKIKIVSGKGGDGKVGFHREKYVAAGGPDGGDGGRGGSVIFKVDDNLSTLLDFRYKKKYVAAPGEPGGGKRCKGKDGADLIIRVPRGTIIRDQKTGQVMKDMSDSEPFVAAKGGNGGWGNTHFATPTRQAPRFAKPGLPGVERDIILELKLLADVGLVGFPNVGKSTLLSMASAARPKIANYHFTTLVPNLGVVSVGEEQNFVMADIPGIIEGASEGAGLGHDFLRHIDRCRLLLHLVDAAGSEGRDPLDDIEKINAELAGYSEFLAARPQIIVANKTDLLGEDREPVEKLRKYAEEHGFLFAELSAATNQGVRELMVIAQDTTYYGIDLYGRRMLAELLRRLCRIDGIEWIRLHYAYPAGFPDEVIEAMASEPKICKYLDIPFQHISDAQLASMHRRHTKAEAMELIGRLRGAIPDLALRTTLLVGYPGETEADFEELLAFVREVRFERLGVFPYSEEEGTWSAENLRDDIPETIKQQRAERVMALQNEISLENNRRRVGRTERVIIDSRQGDWYVGRTQYDSPEVDQEILIPASERRLLRGHFYDVTVTSAADYDLYGEIAAK